MRGLACLILVLACAPAAAAPAEPGEPQLSDVPQPGDYRDRPVFFERYLDRYADPGDLPLLRQGYVRVQHYDAIDVRDFEWERTPGTDYTWWMQMQEMRFLLPLIASRSDADRAIAREWLTRWFVGHVAEKSPLSEWGEPMTWAYRALVFTYYLRSEQLHARPDEAVVDMLLRAILEHQRWLLQHYEMDNNHGFIDALGLYETTRVYDDDDARDLAAQRLRALTRLSVSAHGVHREHAAGYHFAVLAWLDEISAYMAEGPVSVQETVRELRAAADRMRAAAYYLQDHKGGIPQIGDTDSASVDKFGSQYRVARAPAGKQTLFDTDAGYAVFKGSERHHDDRYVVFRVPAQPDAMAAHAHMDALSVLYAVDGETLLGDAGKYSYGRDQRRYFCRSGIAHNTVVPALTQPDPALGRDVPLAEHVRNDSSADTTRWSATLTNAAHRVTRTVMLPREDRALIVVDTVRASPLPAPTRRPGEAVPPDAPTRAVLLWNLGSSVREISPQADGAGEVRSWRLVTTRGRRFDLGIRVVGVDSAPVVQMRLARGEDRPLLGWYSPRHGVMRPAFVLVVQIEGEAIIETRVDEMGSPARRR